MSKISPRMRSNGSLFIIVSDFSDYAPAFLKSAAKLHLQNVTTSHMWRKNAKNLHFLFQIVFFPPFRVHRRPSQADDAYSYYVNQKTPQKCKRYTNNLLYTTPYHAHHLHPHQTPTDNCHSVSVFVFLPNNHPLTPIRRENCYMSLRSNCWNLSLLMKME